MQIVSTPESLRQTLAALRHNGKRVAFVPTMGALHEGHATLMRQARQQTDVLVASIYVNPLQFGANEDLERYPRSIESDIACCEHEGVDILFTPETLYPNGTPHITLCAGSMANMLCGAHRPGHFDGVLTVVNILFNLVQPDVAYFGNKDFQQLTLIRRMVHELCMPLEVQGVATMRESDGLAMSSRNRYLSPAERQQAAYLNQVLAHICLSFQQGMDDISTLCAQGIAALQKQGISPDYLEIRDADSLELCQIANANCQVLLAARIGNTRLIDNMNLGEFRP